MFRNGLTTIDTNIDTEVEGYVVKTPIVGELTERIKAIQAVFTDEFGHKVWAQPADKLYLPLMDWVRPALPRPKGKLQADEVFEKNGRKYHNILDVLMIGTAPIDVTFDTLTTAVNSSKIVLEGHDDGGMQHLRTGFSRAVGSVDVPDVPRDIQVPILRFTESVLLRDVDKVVGSIEPDLSFLVDAFQLYRETRLPMLEAEPIGEPYRPEG